MKFLFKTQFSLSNYRYLIEFFPFLLKTLWILFCALFPLLIGFFKYNRTHVDKEPLFEEDYHDALQEHVDFEEDYHDALQEHVDFDEIETPISSLSFRFQTYEEFIRKPENVDSAISNDFVEEKISSSSNPDPENSPTNDLDLDDDIIIIDDDEIDDLIDAITEKVEEDDDDDFFKQLQDEIMKNRAKAKFKSILPSIPEESDYSVPNSEDLKPLKKEESLNHKNVKQELHKFYKLYLEKMRKYDTLNRQITYAKELKKLKPRGLVESVSSKGLCGCRPEKKGEAKTGENRGIEREMEMVYVVQLWISWEFIVWQYKKSLEINGSCRFNEAAEKFQNFKVTIQRFMENESFDEGSRFECYARTRLAGKKLLQVPLIKEDDDNDDEDAVKIDKLIEIMQESIRILWKFIEADKLAHISTLKCHIEAEQECTSPGSAKIVKQILMQKERKLKKIIKRRDRTLKNCKKKDGLEDQDDPNDELYFLAMVDLKLVSRVLNMKSITKHQLNWCHHKLSCITFSNGKIKTQPLSVFFLSS